MISHSSSSCGPHPRYFQSQKRAFATAIRPPTVCWEKQSRLRSNRVPCCTRNGKPPTQVKCRHSNRRTPRPAKHTNRSSALLIAATDLAIGFPQTLSSIRFGNAPRRSSSDGSDSRFCARLRLSSAGVEAPNPGDSTLSPLSSRRSFRRFPRPLRAEGGPS